MKCLAFLFVLAATNGRLAFAWKLCSEEEGGGICPDETTCCPTGIPGESNCIPLVHTSGPAGLPKGLCCGDASACRFGYECAVSKPDKNLRVGPTHGDRTEHSYCRATYKSLILDYLAKDTPRYDLCRIPEGATEVHGFPVAVSSDPKSPDFTAENSDNVFHLAYLSNIGPIASFQDNFINEETPMDRHEGIEKAIIVIHGSLRDAEDYFCAGLSLLDESNRNSTMILAPKFASVHDPMEDSTPFLVWEDQVYANKDFLWHIWRYGADAANAPISSYRALDALVEHLANDRNQFPNLHQITLVGHSAGGQTLQRWSLLSNSPAWDTIDIRVVAANPRSYAYLDGRRWFKDTKSQNHVFRLPRDKLEKQCPWYNQWLWGLEDGGDVPCPYRDTAIEQIGSADAMAQRYASRTVTYLSGEYDTIAQTKDHCGNAIQGRNRHERALFFYKGLQEHFGGNPDPPVHTFHTIPKSNHDHALMFQSQLGRDAILGQSPSTSSSSAGDTSSSARREKSTTTTSTAY